MTERLPTDTKVFLALLTLLERHGVPSSGRIASVRRTMHRAKPVYWITASEKAEGLVTQALSEFFDRPMPAKDATWKLSLEHVERVLEWWTLHRLPRVKDGTERRETP
jgi:hypothetical protein